MSISPTERYPVTDRATAVVQRAGRDRYRRLVDAGWTFAESVDVDGSAVTSPIVKQIIFHPKVAKRQSRRDVFYVAEHEVGHALDFEAGKPSRLLAEELGLNVPSAQEALAEAVAYWARKSSSEERAWILTSIAWHVKSKWRWNYKWSHVRHAATCDLADMLVRGPGSNGVGYWAWNGTTIVAF